MIVLLWQFGCVVTPFYHAGKSLWIFLFKCPTSFYNRPILIDPYKSNYTVHEQGLLLEKDVRFERGQFLLGNSLKIARMTDRIEFIYQKFSGKTLDGTTKWYSDLKQCIDLRNKLVHPKNHIQINLHQVEQANLAVISTINELYKAVYKRGFPVADRGIISKETLM